MHFGAAMCCLMLQYATMLHVNKSGVTSERTTPHDYNVKKERKEERKKERIQYTSIINPSSIHQHHWSDHQDPQDHPTRIHPPFHIVHLLRASKAFAGSSGSMCPQLSNRPLWGVKAPVDECHKRKKQGNEME